MTHEIQKVYQVPEKWLVGLLKCVDNVVESKGTKTEVLSNATLEGYASSVKSILEHNEYINL